MIKPLLDGNNIGLMSEAGCPGVADPGAVIVKLAHEKGIQVIPLVGPCSILLAMMASGMNGQSFAFNGYLPIDKNEKKSSFKKFRKTCLMKKINRNYLLKHLIETINYLKIFYKLYNQILICVLLVILLYQQNL